MFHSGKVCICIATVSTEFRVDANSCYLIDNRKIKPGILQSTRAEHDKKKNKNNNINQCLLYAIDSRIDAV